MLILRRRLVGLLPADALAQPCPAGRGLRGAAFLPLHPLSIFGARSIPAPGRPARASPVAAWPRGSSASPGGRSRARNARPGRRPARPRPTGLRSAGGPEEVPSRAQSPGLRRSTRTAGQKGPTDGASTRIHPDGTEPVARNTFKNQRSRRHSRNSPTGPPALGLQPARRSPGGPSRPTKTAGDLDDTWGRGRGLIDVLDSGPPCGLRRFATPPPSPTVGGAGPSLGRSLGERPLGARIFARGRMAALRCRPCLRASL